MNNSSSSLTEGMRGLLDSGHYQILMDIINHPKPHHVLLEIPLCTTIMDCQKKMKQITGIHGLTLFPSKKYETNCRNKYMK